MPSSAVSASMIRPSGAVTCMKPSDIAVGAASTLQFRAASAAISSTTTSSTPVLNPMEVSPRHSMGCL
jgi:hypothetical protein